MGQNPGLKRSHECSSLIDFFVSHPYMSLDRDDSACMASHCNLTAWKDLKEKITDMAGNSHQWAPWLSDCAEDVSFDGRSITADAAEGGRHSHIQHSHTSSTFPPFPPPPPLRSTALQPTLCHWSVKPVIRLESKAIHHFTAPNPKPASYPVSTGAQTLFFIQYLHTRVNSAWVAGTETLISSVYTRLGHAI